MGYPVNFILLYQENSDAACSSTTRYFHGLDNAKAAMQDDFAKQDAILHFPTTTSDQDDENFTDRSDMSISVHMGIDSFSWEILEAKAEDAPDDD